MNYTTQVPSFHAGNGLEPDAMVASANRWTSIRASGTRFTHTDSPQPSALVVDGQVQENVKFQHVLDLDLRDTDVAGNSVMHYAAFFDQPSVIQDLLKMGALATQSNLSGQTPIDTAVAALSYDSVLTLHRAGSYLRSLEHTAYDHPQDSPAYSLANAILRQGSELREEASLDRKAPRPKIIISKDSADCLTCDFSTWTEGSRYGKKFRVNGIREFRNNQESRTMCKLCSYMDLCLSYPGRQAEDISVQVLLGCESSMKSGKDLIQYSSARATCTFELCCDPVGTYGERILFVSADIEKSLDIQLSKADSVLRGLTIGEDYAAQLRKWLAACKSHDCASADKSSRLPQRLLDLSPEGCPSNHIRLRETSDLSGSDVEYVLLSFTWGTTPQKTVLSSSNYHDFEAGVDASTLPRLVQDAITVCRQVGYRYLFVDMLCVIYDDLDMNYYTSQFAGVINNAHIVIGATAYDTEDSLFPTDVHLDKRPPLEAYIEGHEETPFKLHIREVVESAQSVMQGKILSRAWRQQENFSAARLVVFGREQIYWSCGQILAAQGSLDKEEAPWTTIPTMQRQRAVISRVLPQEEVKKRDYRYWYQLSWLK